jgi:hypothetical protein
VYTGKQTYFFPKHFPVITNCVAVFELHVVPMQRWLACTPQRASSHAVTHSEVPNGPLTVLSLLALLVQN